MSNMVIIIVFICTLVLSIIVGIFVKRNENNKFNNKKSSQPKSDNIVLGDEAEFQAVNDYIIDDHILNIRSKKSMMLWQEDVDLGQASMLCIADSDFYQNFEGEEFISEKEDLLISDMQSIQQVITNKKLIEFRNNFIQTYFKLASGKPSNSTLTPIPIDELITDGCDKIQSEGYIIY